MWNSWWGCEQTKHNHMILIIVQQDHSNTHSLGNFIYYHFIDINHITMVEGITSIQRRCMFNPLLSLNFICDLHFTLNLDSIKCDRLNYNICISRFFIFSTKLHSLRLHWLNHKVNSQNSPLEYTSLYMHMKSSLTRTPCENNNWAHQYLQNTMVLIDSVNLAPSTRSINFLLLSPNSDIQSV